MAAIALEPSRALAWRAWVDDNGAVAGDVRDFSSSSRAAMGAPASLPLTREAMDRADLAAVCNGDRDALARLYERHREGLFGFILRVTSYDRMLAEEVLQDTLLAVWFHAASFAGNSQVRTWIYSIARRNALSKLRKKRPDPVDPEAAIPVIDTGPGPDDDALARVEAGVLNGLIDRLPEQLRVILVLAFVEDMPYPEISEVLEVPIGTVKSRVSRARAALVQLGRQAGVVA